MDNKDDLKIEKTDNNKKNVWIDDDEIKIWLNIKII